MKSSPSAVPSPAPSLPASPSATAATPAWSYRRAGGVFLGISLLGHAALLAAAVHYRVDHGEGPPDLFGRFGSLCPGSSQSQSAEPAPRTKSPAPPSSSSAAAARSRRAPATAGIRRWTTAPTLVWADLPPTPPPSPQTPTPAPAPEPAPSPAAAPPAAAANTFFGLPVPDRRTVFILDYSKSMQEQNRHGLTSRELEKVLGGLKEGMSYQIILFAGYAWLPGDQVVLAKDQMSATVTDPSGKVFNWKRPTRANFDWIAFEGRDKHFIRPLPWRNASAPEIAGTLELLKKTPLEMNTSWELPLEMALAMKPAPEAIYFMTDGITGDSSAQTIVDKIVRKAYPTRTRLNTISIMEPKETAAMQSLAEKSGGGFSIVDTEGKGNVVFPEKPPAAAK